MTCTHCTHPLYAGIRCGVCGRWTDEKEEDMNRDDIRRMAREVRFVAYGEDAGEYRIPAPAFHSRLERFAALVAAAEREACISIIESHRIPVGNSAAGEMACEWTYDALHEIRDAIRARGEK